FEKTKVQQVICQMRPGEIFSGKIGDAPRIDAAVCLDASDGSLENTITNCEREREIKIVFRGNAFGAPEGVMQIVEERLLDFVSGRTSASSFLHRSEGEDDDARNDKRENREGEN